MDNFSRCTGSDSANSANRKPEHKMPDAGFLQVPKCEGLMPTISTMLSGFRSRLGSQAYEGAHTGHFSCSRTPHDSNEPAWAARKNSPARLHPSARRLACKRGTRLVGRSSGETCRPANETLRQFGAWCLRYLEGMEQG